MKVEVICATRGRPDQAREMARTALRTSGQRVAVRAYVDDDDPRAAGYAAPELGVLRGPRVYSRGAFEALARTSAADFMVWVGDDVRFETPDWDLILATKADPARPAVLGLNSGGGDPIKIAHGAFTQGWRDAVGGLFRDGFIHYCVDTHICRVARELGCFVWVPEVVLRHLRQKQGWDPTSAEFSKVQAADAATWKGLDWGREIARYRRLLG